MRKVWSIILISLIVLSLTSCGESESKNDGKWYFSQIVDEFGDVVKDGEKSLCVNFSGDFSNTATTKDNLTGSFSFRKNNAHYIAEISLLEYGNTPITYNTNDKICIKTKIVDNTSEYLLTGESPKGNLFLGANPHDYSADIVFNELYNGSDIRCIIYIGSSQYNFTLTSKNFSKICKEEKFELASAEMTVDEAIAILLSDDLSLVDAAGDCLDEKYENFEILTNEELNKYLNGTFIEISTGGRYGIELSNGKTIPYCSMEIFKYTPTQHIQEGEFKRETWGRYYQKTITPHIFDFYIENNAVINKEQGYSFEYRKITDDIFLQGFKGKDDNKFHGYNLVIFSNHPINNIDDIPYRK